MHDWPLVHLDDGFWCGRAVTQSTVGPFRVVVFPPSFDDDLGFSERVEDFTVQQLVSEPGVEALYIAVLPRASRLDIGGLGANGCNPIPNRLSDELGAIIASHICRWPTQDEQVGQSVDHISRVQLSLDPDRQALPTKLNEDVQRVLSQIP